MQTITLYCHSEISRINKNYDISESNLNQGVASRIVPFQIDSHTGESHRIGT